jgi:hypothetical protein
VGGAVVGDDGEAAGHDVRVGDEDLLERGQPDRLHLRQGDEVVEQDRQAGPVGVDEPGDLAGAVGAVGVERAEVRVAGAQRVGQQREVAVEALELLTDVALGVEGGLAVAQQGLGLRQRLLGAAGQQVARVDDLGERLTGLAVEGLAELVDDDAELLGVDAGDEVVEVDDQLAGLDRDVGRAERDDRALGEERLAVARGLQVDVLLTDGRAVADTALRSSGTCVPAAAAWTRGRRRPPGRGRRPCRS